MAQFHTDQQEYHNNWNLFDVVMLADKDGNILSTSGSASNIPIAAGSVGGYAHINKFGYSDVFKSTPVTVWDDASIYAYPSIATVAAVSGNATDTGALINIQGLDENGVPVAEDVLVGASSTTLFKRVFRAKLMEHPSLEVNDDDITVTVDAKSAAIIKAGKGQTLMALYTIPAGKTGYLLKFQGTVDKANNAIFYIITKVNGGVVNTKGQFGTFGVPVTYDYPVPLVFEEGTDVEVRVVGDSTMSGGAIFDLILVDNPA
jgi:hypothetical protein